MSYRAGTIGRTGRGDYGHSLDMSWTGLPGLEYRAVADEDPNGRAAAARRTGAAAQYTDYGEMLANERLDLVSVGPRWPDCHAEMVVACAEAGVRGILTDKPLATSLEEADRMLAACRANEARLAIAHQSRVTPPVVRARELLQQGAIGNLLMMRGRGKEDRRGGGVDLMVLGTHVLDMMCFFAGDPLWCFGSITQDGRPITLADARPGPEAIGPTAGNEVLALYGFAGSVRGTFESFHDQEGGGRRMGVDLYGSQGILSIRGMMDREVYLYRGPLWSPRDAGPWEWIEARQWEAIPADHRLVYTNRLLARDLIVAIEEGREPVASGTDGRMALEMIMAVYASALSGARVSIPLSRREHPLLDPR
ncbi:MAG: Gfo/Idh/MocA family oxidoreductase [Chloroflexi bacterium]|nr:Gfo/Idh/MocA family oxidoreductase [Chloroflexota bacterium]